MLQTFHCTSHLHHAVASTPLTLHSLLPRQGSNAKQRPCFPLQSDLTVCKARPPFVSRREVNPARCSAIAGGAASSAPPQLPEFLPQTPVTTIQEQAAIDMLVGLRREAVEVPGLGTVQTAVAGPSSEQLGGYAANAPLVVLLHGFDSSVLEFRRLMPQLVKHCPTFAIDTVGWGFTDLSLFVRDEKLVAGRSAKRDHLTAWLQQQERNPLLAGRPVVLVGASLGGAAALDFALTYPQMVSRLVLLSPQIFIDGTGPGQRMPRWAAKIGVEILRTQWLRTIANLAAYHDKARYATADAMHVQRLHTFMPGWREATMSYMKSGGYHGLLQRVNQVQVPTLVLWGRQDGILRTEYAAQLVKAMPRCVFHWIENCGHLPHLEQVGQVAKQLLDFINVTKVDIQPTAAAAATPAATLAAAPAAAVEVGKGVGRDVNTEQA